MGSFDGVRALAFDLFGTVLDLDGSLVPPLATLLRSKGSRRGAAGFWAQWRARQRIEQYQDTILMLGHSGYLEVAERALRYTLRLNEIRFEQADIERAMGYWQELEPFAEVRLALERLSSRFRLVALSNGNADFLAHLAKNRVRWDFDEIISVDRVGAFKPHPAVYRRATQILALEPSACLMVSANSFDVLGARACGLRAAFVNRRGLPYEDSPLQPDLTVTSFSELADALLGPA